ECVERVERQAECPRRALRRRRCRDAAQAQAPRCERREEVVDRRARAQTDPGAVANEIGGRFGRSALLGFSGARLHGSDFSLTPICQPRTGEIAGTSTIAALATQSADGNWVWTFALNDPRSSAGRCAGSSGARSASPPRGQASGTYGRLASKS